MQDSQTLFQFDALSRAKFFGHNSAHTLYRKISCNEFIPHIKVPFLVLLSNNDPITRVEMVPHTDLLRNPNCALVEASYGGHCDFFCERDKEVKSEESNGYLNLFNIKRRKERK